MAPTKPNAKKNRTTATLSSAQRGIAKRSSNKTTSASSGNVDEGVDRISCLPDTILGCILTLLSVTDAMRMAVQSKTWMKVFKSPDYKINSINDADLWRGRRRLRRLRDNRLAYLKQSERHSSMITSLLDTRHRSSIHRFIINRTTASDDVMSGWLYALSQSGIIKELVLEMPLQYPVGLSHSLFNCRSLRSLSLSNCRWPPSDVQAIYSLDWTLPLVTELTLSYMDMTAEALKDLLTRCPALQSLSLGYTQHYVELEIRCKNLLSLTKVSRWQYAVRIVDAPKLERLLWWPMAPRVTFERTITAQVPRLHTIGILQHCPLEDGVVLEQVRTIALFTNVDNSVDLYRAIKTLHHLPHLETLHIKMKDGSESESKSINFEEYIGSPFACLENSIKTIILRVNNLVRQKLAFTNYLLRAAKSLRLMVIYKKRMAGELLVLKSRGSSDAQIVFCDNHSGVHSGVH